MKKQRTFVSVIIPVYNNKKELKKCLKNLDKQKYPKENYEIIVVDNNSSEDIKTVVKKFDALLLEENEIQSSYAARNKGIKNAKGDILAFIDSDCVPVNEWIENGVKGLLDNNVDLIGGNVEFTFSKKKTAAELVDSMTNMQIEDNIKKRQVAKTANLFVNSYVFCEIGLFPDNVKSGGDVDWTKKATTNGFKLAYSHGAKVFHPARKLKELMKKQIRVGKGKASIFENESFIYKFKKVLRGLLPPKPSSIRKKINKKGYKGIKKGFISIWIVFYLIKISTNIGKIKYLIKK